MGQSDRTVIARQHFCLTVNTISVIIGDAGVGRHIEPATGFGIGLWDLRQGDAALTRQKPMIITADPVILAKP